MPEQLRAYIITVDMGYGHQRAAYPLKDIATRPASIPLDDGLAIISANTYPGIPRVDKTRWEGGRTLYETISRMKKVPIVGTGLFGIMNYLQRIESFYPKRDLSAPTAQVKQIYRMIRRGWGRDLIEKLNEEPLPFVTTFFSTAFFAEEHGYKGEIYCLCTDTDISRAWAPYAPATSRINYFAPNKRVSQRLQLYGVRPEKIFVTGFPLPKENIGGKDLPVLKKSLANRLVNLDPGGKYCSKYRHTIKHYLGASYMTTKSDHPLTITFAVGGAGAQRDIGIQILDSLHEKIDAGNIVLNLVAGARKDVFDYYQREVRRLHFDKKHAGHVRIIYGEKKSEYFEKFNKALLTTDILWTKPSELSFYAALGLPIIMAPGIGSQEDFNRAWLHAIGAGFEQEDARYTHEWLFDWLESGWLAQAAMEGFMNAPRNGAYHIEEVALTGRRSEIEDMHLL
ncbi:MAG: hypothetical protein A3J66_02680 [Candidatus Magasanikbacteria bacterium RIFCSPHIGHO2_02_FULL_47_14]|uniref:DUF6938 domain-containing protein n=1 Tax=Candidatus Magasanikbacteria bacterium RIFCSPHIGHO2_02_FULL_47_14 TaxID=1798680 RepID=A0A1F6M725_9BACT|nr:MAG: hypothetical protein A3J66_02680 [Candidatus Magasanikbacteria bacterium RIFCSPHIGHO2_02_FULL_47_14]